MKTLGPTTPLNKSSLPFTPLYVPPTFLSLHRGGYYPEFDAHSSLFFFIVLPVYILIPQQLIFSFAHF